MSRDTINSKEIKGIANRHLYSRISYLHQAAQYLASTSNNTSAIAVKQKDTLPLQMNGQSIDSNNSKASSTDYTLATGEFDRGKPSNQALRLSSHLLAICRRTKVKASCDMKRSICKSCNELLVPGKTTIIRMENKSKGSKKPWANVLVTKCQRCGFKRRYPVGQER